MNLTAPKTSYS